MLLNENSVNTMRIVLVSPDGTESDWHGDEAHSTSADVPVKSIPANVVPLPASRQDALVIGDKVPTLRAHAAAGFSRKSWSG
jgi:hypothetical protein